MCQNGHILLMECFCFTITSFTVDNSKYVYGKTCDLSDDDVYSFYGLKYIRLVTSIKLK